MEPISACLSLLSTVAKLAERVIAVERLVAELDRITNGLGEQQVRSALRALEKARISNDPSRELGSAINHLEDALSHFRQGYLVTDYSRRQKVARAFLGSDNKGFVVPDDNPRYEVGKSICTVLAIMIVIYDSIGEPELALNHAEELHDEVSKAYPSAFYIEALVPGWNYPSSWNASALDSDRDLGYWFSAQSRQDLEEAFFFFESVNRFIMQVGANPFNPQLKVKVRHISRLVKDRNGIPSPTYRFWNFIIVSSREDLIVQYRKALPRG